MTTERDIRNQIAYARKEGHLAGVEEGIELGIEKGIEQGVEKNRRENARNLISMGLSDEDIARATGLTVNAVADLRKRGNC